MIVRDQAMMPSVVCSFCNLCLLDGFRMDEKKYTMGLSPTRCDNTFLRRAVIQTKDHT